MPRAAHLLVLDGVPQTDPFGGWVNWPAYDPQDLARNPRRARRRKRRQRTRRARRHDRDDQPRRMRASSGEIDGGSRDSLEARGRLGVDAGGGVLSLSGARRAQRRLHSDHRGARAARPTSRAPYREWSGRARWVAPVGAVDRAAGERRRLPRLAHARHRFHARTAPTAPTPRCGWSGAATGSGARSAIGSGAT